MRVLSSLIAASFALASSAEAQEAKPPPIRTFSIETIEALGREIYHQDAAAWVATDAVAPRMQDFSKAHVVGWIVVPNGDGQRVRFVRDTAVGLEAYYDVDVDSQFHIRVFAAPDRHLTADEVAAFTARQTASRNVPAVCRPGYNSVVAKDPQGDGWLVCMLANADAGDDTRRRPLSLHPRRQDCGPPRRAFRELHRHGSEAGRAAGFPTRRRLRQPRRLADTGGDPRFPADQAKLPMYVVAAGEVWKIDGGHITNEGKSGAAKP